MENVNVRLSFAELNYTESKVKVNKMPNKQTVQD
jgi:hypothetical protein